MDACTGVYDTHCVRHISRCLKSLKQGTNGSVISVILSIATVRSDKSRKW